MSAETIILDKIKQNCKDPRKKDISIQHLTEEISKLKDNDKLKPVLQHILNNVRKIKCYQDSES
jgi:hypothetical protein